MSYYEKSKPVLWGGTLPWKQAAKKWWQIFLEEKESRQHFQATADKRLELLRRYEKLLLWIVSSHKGSIGSIDNVYLPQLDRDKIDAMFDELAEELGDVPKRPEPDVYTFTKR